jgi:hypothetical protein
MTIDGHAYGPLVFDVTRHGAATDGDATAGRRWSIDQSYAALLLVVVRAVTSACV